MKERGFVQIEDDRVRVASSAEGTFAITFLSSLLWPFIDSYWMTFVFISSLLPTNFIDEAKMQQKVQWFAETMYQERVVSFYESCSLDTINNAILKFKQWGLLVLEERIGREGKQKKMSYHLNDEWVSGEDEEAKLQAMYDELTFFKKKSFVNLPNIRTEIRKGLLADFPFMAKI